MIKRCTQAAATLLCAVLLAFGTAGVAAAQGVTTSAVSGRVTNQQGAPVAGATVTVTSGSTGAQNRVVTRADGRYTIQGLQPGSDYRVTVTGLGLATQTRTGVQLVLSQTQRLDFTLAPQAIVLEGVVARGERSGATFSRTRTGPATTVRDSALRRLPTISRDISDYSRLVPQIATASGGSNAAGRNSRFNNIQIDGAVNNDVFGLSTSGTPGGQASARPISLEAIQELQVVLAPYDVRQGGFTGAGINAVTKSGTNRLAGTLTYLTRNESLVGNYRYRQADTAALSTPFTDFNEKQYGASLGGPIIRNRVHFFFAGEHLDRTNPQGFVAGNQSSIPAPLAQRVAEQVKGYGFDPGAVLDRTQTRNSTNLFGRLDFNLTDNQRLTIRHNYVDAQDDNLARRNDLYQLGNTNYVFRDKTNSTVAQLNSTFGSNLSNELRFNRSTIRDARDPGSTPFPYVRIGVGGTNFVIAGPENSSVANKLDQDIYELTNDLTLSAGAHRITLGTHNEFFSFDNLFAQNIYGNYRFADTAAFNAGTPNQYSYTYLNPNNPNARQSAAFDVRQYAVYLQDQFEAGAGVTLTGGIRLDATRFPDSPAQNDSVLKYYKRSTSEVGAEPIQISPRLGFNWDVTGDQTTQLRGGVGLFAGRTPYVWISNAFGNTGLDYIRFQCTTAASSPKFSPDPANQPKSCVGTTNFTPNEINTIDPDFKLPQVFRASLGLDRRLPGGVVATFEGLYNKSLNDPAYRNLAIRTDSLTGPATSQGLVEGRPRYGRFFNNGTGGIGQVYDVFNTNKNYTYSLTGQLARSFGRALDLRVAYTYTESQDVNPLRSSTASSNFGFNLTRGNPNEVELSPSDWLVRHRVLANGTYTTSFVRRAPTEISFIYEGESGRPYSYRYDGDVNNDGATGNDLIYVPRDASEVRFQGVTANNPLTPQQSWANLNDFINRVPCLNKARGRVLKRNECNQPFSNRIDVRVAQTVPTFQRQRVQLTLDVLNFTNLLNPRWGTSQTISNQADPLLSVTNTTPNAAGRVEIGGFQANRQVYQYSNLGSRYQIQLGARYVF